MKIVVFSFLLVSSSMPTAGAITSQFTTGLKLRLFLEGSK